MNLTYDLKELKNFFIDIYNLTEFRIALFDVDFNEVLSYPTRLSTFCRNVRCDDKLNELCRAYDYNSFSLCKTIKRPVCYECHAGLTEIIIPIISKSNMIIGYIMCGQVFKESSQFNNWENLFNYLKDFNVECDELKINFQNRPKISGLKLNSATNLIELSTMHLHQSGKLKLESTSLAYKIDEYILKNITNEINPAVLCEKFGFHKTKFYEVTNQLYGVGIAKHIRQMRIQQAKILLSTTNLNVQEIALEVGIGDYNYFTKVFKEEAHCTPREFRKNDITKLDL